MRPLEALRRCAWIANQQALWRRQTEVWGRRLYSPTFDRWLYLQLHRWGAMGGSERRLLAQLIQPGMTVVDVGANIGLYTLLLSRLVGERGAVHAFEPVPELFEALERNVERSEAGNVTLYQAAAGAESGTLPLRRGVLHSGGGRIAPRSASTSTGTRSEEMMPVRVVRLDDQVAGAVDLVKLDVQGWEQEAVRGMANMLGRPGTVLLIELWPQGLRAAGADPSELLEQLRAIPMRLETADVDRRRKITDDRELVRRAAGFTGRGYTNILAVTE